MLVLGGVGFSVRKKGMSRLYGVDGEVVVPISSIGKLYCVRYERCVYGVRGRGRGII